MVLASSMPEVTVKDLLRVLLRAEQMMVHLQKLWKNDHQKQMTHRPVQPGCQELKKLLLFRFRALCWCFNFVKLQSLQQSRPCLLDFILFAGKKIKNEFRINTQGTWT